MNTTVTNLADLLVKHQAEGDRFAAALGNFIVDLQPQIVVETGYGVSSLFLLSALDATGQGCLHSVDPKPWFKDQVAHPRHTLWRAKSYDALGQIFAENGPWDLFLHDSNHDIECMTYELEFGYSNLKPGGWIFCDDSSWGGHGAWDNFLKRHGLSGLTMGSLVYTQKPESARVPTQPCDVRHTAVRTFAREATEAWVAAGNEAVSAAFRE